MQTPDIAPCGTDRTVPGKGECGASQTEDRKCEDARVRCAEKFDHRAPKVRAALRVSAAQDVFSKTARRSENRRAIYCFDQPIRNRCP